MKTSKIAYLFVLLGSMPTWGLGQETFGNSNSRLMSDESWPGIEAVLDDSHRVYTRWVNGTTVAHFRGDTESLNEFLNRFSAFECEVHEVVLRPGPGVTQTFEKRDVIHDWSIYIPGYFDARDAKKETGTRVIDRHPSVTVYVDEDRDIDLHEIYVPTNLKLLGSDSMKARYTGGLSSPNKDIRARAVNRLAYIGPHDKMSVDAISTLLLDDEQWVRVNAASALGRMGWVARSALPTLEQGLRDPNERVQGSCRRAIDKIESASRPRSNIREHRAMNDEINRFLRKRVR